MLPALRKWASFSCGLIEQSICTAVAVPSGWANRLDSGFCANAIGTASNSFTGSVGTSNKSLRARYDDAANFFAGGVSISLTNFVILSVFDGVVVAEGRPSL